VWIFIVLIIIIAGGGYAYYQYALVPEELSDAPSIQTATVRQGDLIIRASGSGELIALNEVDLLAPPERSLNFMCRWEMR
jgi:hypothetical protein